MGPGASTECDRERARDILQESLLAAAGNIGSYRGDAALSSWLYAIAHSFCFKRLRKAQPQPIEPQSEAALRQIRKLDPRDP